MDHPSKSSEKQSTAPHDASDVGIRDRLHELTVYQQDFERRLARHIGTDAAGLSVINHLGSHGSATPTEIAGVLGASTAATTLVLNRLENAGHIVRNPHPTDRRKVIITPNPDALRVAYQVLNPIISGVDNITERMNPAHRDVVVAFLEDMITLYAQQASGRS